MNSILVPGKLSHDASGWSWAGLNAIPLLEEYRARPEGNVHLLLRGLGAVAGQLTNIDLQVACCMQSGCSLQTNKPILQNVSIYTKEGCQHCSPEMLSQGASSMAFHADPAVLQHDPYRCPLDPLSTSILSPGLEGHLPDSGFFAAETLGSASSATPTTLDHMCCMASWAWAGCAFCAI